MLKTFLVVCIAALPSSDIRNSKQQLENALQEMRQSAYELGIDLAMREKQDLRANFRKFWSSVSRVRSLGVDRKIRDAFRNAIQASGSKTMALKRLDELRAEFAKANFPQGPLDPIAKYAANAEWDKYRHELVSLQDEQAGNAAGIRLNEITSIMREVEKHLGPNPTNEKMDQALSILSQLPGYENGRARALTEAVQIIEDTLESAADLYMEGYFQDAQHHMRQLDRPFWLLSRVQDPAMALRVKQLRSQIDHARRLIEVGVTPPNYRWYVLNSDQQEGLRLMHQCRREAVDILEMATSQPANRNRDR